MLTNIKTFIYTLGIVVILSSLNQTNATKTSAQLLTDLRRAQISAMLREENTKSTLKYPDELALADYRDAHTRSLKAGGVKNITPYSPFRVKKTPNNLGYLGRGYDVLYGNPLDESGRVDTGFRLPVVDLEYLQNKFSADGMYRIPDNADVIMEPSALFSSSFNDVRTVEDYKHQLKEDVKTTVGFGLSGGPYGVSGEFSQSTSYQSNKEITEKGGNVNIDIIGRATAYKARLYTLGDMYASPELQNTIQSLPAQCSDSKKLNAYFELIRKYGTHFTAVVTMGAKAVQRLTMTTAESMILKQEGISTSQVVSATIGFTAKGVSASVKFGHEESSRSETNIVNILQTMDIKRKEFYTGGEPPSLPYTQKYYYSFELNGEQYADDPGIGSTQSLREWGRSAYKHPVPIQYQLQEIPDLFHKSHLPNISDSDMVISAKKTCMLKALREYCSKVTTDDADCMPNDDTKELDAIRYGDLISIQKVSTKKAVEYLNVPENDPKFVSGNQAEEMKVVPVDQKAFWKYGTVLHYEEPFSLITKYGGQQQIISCGFGTRENYFLFNSGSKDIKCEAKALPIGLWTPLYEYWCNKNKGSLLPKKTTVRECAKECIDKLGDKCVGIQYVGGYTEKCAHCQAKDQVEPFTDISQIGARPVNFYNRVDVNRTLPYPKLPTTLYFASPEGKKTHDVVTKNDKVYIGITSFEERKPLFDVRRPAFLKAAQKEAHVHVDKGEPVSNIDDLKSCTTSPKRTQLQCSFWWKVLANRRTLRTYPNAHYE